MILGNKDCDNDLNDGNLVDIYVDFKNDLVLIANPVNNSIVYSIQNEEILQTNIKNKVIFHDLITNGNWKKLNNF